MHWDDVTAAGNSLELGDGDGGCSGDDTATPDGDLELDLGSSVHWDDDTAAGNSLELGV